MTGVGQVRVGVIGASIHGGWAMQSHVPALLRLPGFRLHAVATTRLSSAEETAAQYGAARAYADAAELATDPEVDLVTVAVKVPAHHDAVAAAIRAGKDVYCEWPLGVNTAQARSLHELAAAAGVRHTVGLQARVSPVVLHLRDLVADGFVGRVLAVRLFSAGVGLGGATLPADREWAADKDNGLSALTVRTAHTVDALEFAVGGLTEVSSEVVVATSRPMISGTERTVLKSAPDQVVLSGRLEGGATVSGHFLLGVRPVATPLMTVMGTGGTLAVTADTPDGQVQMSELTLLAARGAERLSPLALPPGYVRTPAEMPPGPASGVAAMYLAMQSSPADDVRAPDFGDAVRLHELLDVVQEAADGTRRRISSAERAHSP